MTQRLSSQLGLNGEQAILLKKDIRVFLENRKPQAKRILVKFENTKAETLDIEKLFDEFWSEYQDLILEFTPMYSKYLVMLNPSQINRFEKEFEDKNEEMEEQIKEEDIDSTEDRFETFLGNLSKDQSATIAKNKANFIMAVSDRLARRKKYQKELLLILRGDIENQIKTSRVSKLTLAYNSKREISSAETMNLNTAVSIFSNLSSDQKTYLNSEIANYREWIVMFSKESYTR
ncbi:MAG: hypothetical protein AB8E15_09625 [Bdellovibrionales bacterium]